jgi:tRNA pseudouridine32 synthase/23S rRNA pseudouridine746 synthase
MTDALIKTCEKSIAITENGKRAIDWLADNTPLSRMQLKKALACGAVWLQTGKRQERLRRATRELPANTILHIYFDADIIAIDPPSPTLVADEEKYSVWFKPPGLLSQGSKQGDHCALLRIVEQQLNRKVFLVHRLDREASGLMLIAHTEKAAAALSDLFQSSKIAKHYRASVLGELKLSTLPFMIDSDIDGKHAVTWIDSAVYDAGNRQTHLQIHIDTGRKHQIRRHLAELGHAVVGDARYGKPDGGQVMALQACRIEYVCPLFNRKRNYYFAPSSL